MREVRLLNPAIEQECLEPLLMSSALELVDRGPSWQLWRRSRLLQLSLQCDALTAEQQVLVCQQQELTNQRDQVSAERDQLVVERDGLVQQRDALTAEQQVLVCQQRELDQKLTQINIEMDEILALLDVAQIESSVAHVSSGEPLQDTELLSESLQNPGPEPSRASEPTPTRSPG